MSLPSKLSIGFIGLGQMGSHMAANLLNKSPSLSSLIIHDISKPSLAAFQQRFPQKSSSMVSIASTPREVSERADVVITMLPSSPHVKSAYLDKDSGILAGAKAKQTKGLYIDSSTIDPTTSKLVSQEMHQGGHFCVDAPVSGGVGGAEAGTLTFMVGGTPEEFALAKPILGLMGKNLVHCGPSGTGQVAKICNNMLLGISMLAAAETLNLGTRLGMDAKVLSGIIATSSGRNWSVDTYNPVPGVMPNVPSSRDYKGGFAVELMTKDMQLAAQAALDSKSFNILGGVCKGLFETVCQSHVETASGTTEKLAGKDFSVVFKWMNDNAKKNKW